jgi:hypothetical protein
MSPIALLTRWFTSDRALASTNKKWQENYEWRVLHRRNQEPMAIRIEARFPAQQPCGIAGGELRADGYRRRLLECRGVRDF